MKIISNWIKKRKDKKMRLINENLMEAGYLCPNYELHENELLEWEGDTRNMKCKKCGKISSAMFRSFTPKS